MLTPVWSDREDCITLNEDNILPHFKKDFVKKTYGDAGFHTADSVDHQNTPYDIFSVIVRK